MGAALTAGALALAWASPRFDYLIALEDKPALALVAGLVAAGLVYALLRPLLGQTVRAGLGNDRRLLALIVGIGFVLRLALMASTPALEDDWYRYLWDGAVTAHGYNPYAVSPDEAQSDATAGTLRPLAHESGVVIERVNHADLKTIYPPLAQASFALAHLVQPWSLLAWRAVCLVAEGLTLLLILALLRTLGRPAAWVAVYWWNPVAVKELINSAHMDALLIPLLVGALLLALRERRVAACGVLGLAAGVKLWPVILVPLVLRPVWTDRGRLIRALALLAGVLALVAWPILAGGLDKTSGFRVYAERWQTNTAVFPWIVDGVRAALAGLDVTPAMSALAARGLLALALALVVALVVRPPIAGPRDEVHRATLIVTALILLSPAQFPWYLIWVLPLAAVHPWRGFFAATCLLPVYYASFHYFAIDEPRTFTRGIVWLIWLPVYAAFLLDVRDARQVSGDTHA